MTAKIIDGKQVAAAIRTELKAEVQKLKARGITPGLGVILVGDDPASKSYVTAKERLAQKSGCFPTIIACRLRSHRPSCCCGPHDERRSKNSRNPGATTLAQASDESEVLLAINPDKDVDGFHPVNVGRMVLDRSLLALHGRMA